jgi:arylsulfatase A-like enzyme
LKWRKIPFLKPALLGLLLIFLSFLLLRSESHHRFKYEMKNSPKDKPNVLLITLDTTRADHLSCYGYRRLTTPHLDKFSREGMLYKNAYATASWTLPSHASMFTGKYPTKHGAEYSGHSLYSGNILSKGQRDDRFDPEERARKFLKLPEDNLTLAEILSEKGYRTAGIIGGVFCSSIFGLAQGFDYYDEVFINVKKDIQFFLIFQVIDLFFPLHDLCAQYGYLGKRIASQVNESAFEWLDKNYRQPFFLFINYFDPHVPYFPPPPYDKYFGEVKTDMILLRNHKGESGFVNLEENLIMATLEGRHKLTHDERELLVSQYDGEIRYLDHCLGLLFEKLKALKVYDNTLIVVTSDHGEAFGEHGLIEHGLSLYEEVLRVPLIIKYPSASLRREVVEKRISLVDLLSIILSFLDYSLPLGIDGKNVESLECPVIAETYAMLWSTDRFNRDIKTVYQGEYKYIWSSNKLDELYDLKKDPSEEVNLIARYPLGAQSMKKILEQWLASFKRAGVKREKAYINKSTEERLRSLNYVK